MSKKIKSKCVSGDCKNGTGKEVYEHGYYEGEFKDGLWHGKGYLKFDFGFYSLGKKYAGFYDGEFQHGMRNGVGEELTISEKDDKTLISKATYKNDEYINSIGAILDVTEDKNYEVIFKLNNKLIADKINQDGYEYHKSICDIYDAEEVVKLATCKIFNTTYNEEEDCFNFNTVKDMNDSYYVCLFFNALFYIISEISTSFETSAYQLFGLKTDETEHLTEKDQKKISNWLSENYNNFFNSPEKFQLTINSMINSITTKNKDYHKDIFHEKYDGDFAFENFSINETKKDISENQSNPNQRYYKYDNEFTLKFSLINKNFPDDLRRFATKTTSITF